MDPKHPRYSVAKCPSVYDEYSFKLPELYRNVAENELKEYDGVRNESIKQFRQWIADNPHIRKCRTDAKFLLRFLRFTLFSLPMACEALEKYLTLRTMHPKWFHNLDCNDPNMKKIFQNTFMTYLGQDSMGRSVVYVPYARLDYEELNVMHVARFELLLAETMLEWEVLQIGGCRVLVDYQGTTIDHCKMLDYTNMKMIMDAFSRGFPLRFESVHAAGLPKFAVPIADVFLSCASPKFREKVFCHTTMEDFVEQFEDCLKPSNYGGGIDVEKSHLAFWEKVVEQRDAVLGLDEMEIDMEYYSSKFDDLNSTTNDEVLMALFRQMEMN